MVNPPPPPQAHKEAHRDTIHHLVVDMVAVC